MRRKRGGTLTREVGKDLLVDKAKTEKEDSVRKEANHKMKMEDTINCSYFEKERRVTKLSKGEIRNRS